MEAQTAVGEDGASSDEEKLECRICRDDSSTEELIAPCGCSGSIRWCHQSCLLEWLRHSERERLRSSPQCGVCRQHFQVGARGFGAYLMFRLSRRQLRPLLGAAQAGAAHLLQARCAHLHCHCLRWLLLLALLQGFLWTGIILLSLSYGFVRLIVIVDTVLDEALVPENAMPMVHAAFPPLCELRRGVLSLSVAPRDAAQPPPPPPTGRKARRAARRMARQSRARAAAALAEPPPPDAPPPKLLEWRRWLAAQGARLECALSRRQSCTASLPARPDTRHPTQPPAAAPASYLGRLWASMRGGARPFARAARISPPAFNAAQPEGHRLWTRLWIWPRDALGRWASQLSAAAVEELRLLLGTSAATLGRRALFHAFGTCQQAVSASCVLPGTLGRRSSLCNRVPDPGPRTGAAVALCSSR